MCKHVDVVDVYLDAGFGARVRDLRESAGASRDALARAAQRAGLDWDDVRVAHVEMGRASPTIPTLMGVAQALTEVAGRAVTFADLMPAVGMVSFSDGRVVSAETLRKALAGEPVPQSAVPGVGTSTAPHLERGWGKVDDRLVADIPAAPEEIRSATRELFGRTATEERDARAGSDATPQKRGRVTRSILAEVSEQVGGARAAKRE